MPHAIALVEDDPRFAQAVASSIGSAPDLALVGVASTVAAALAMIDAHRPKVVLVDLNLPDGSGLDLIRHVAERVPGCETLVLTVHGSDDVVMAAIEAGAVGYVLKDAGIAGIAAHIRTVLTGGSPISPAVARHIVRRLRADPARAAAAPPGEDVPTIPPQELAVLQLGSKGYTVAEVAELLQLSPHTVETYVKRLYRRLQVHSKAEAIYEARRLGVLRD